MSKEGKGIIFVYVKGIIFVVCERKGRKECEGN